MRHAFRTAIAGLALLACACASTPEAIQAEVSTVASVDPRLKYKDGERYLADLSDGLAMPRDQICRELGKYDCFTEAFRIVLGGVEGPNLLVHQPLEVEALTAPIAYDRVALHVCTSRVTMDAAQPATAVLFKPEGKASAKPSARWLNATANAIYQDILRRDPTPAERARLAGFYSELAASNQTQDPARDWTVLGCFAVATSLEAIFY